MGYFGPKATPTECNVVFRSQNVLMKSAIDDLGGSSTLTPVPADVLGVLTLPDGSPLPAAVHLWLSASDRWPSGLPAVSDGQLISKTMAALGADAGKWPGHALVLQEDDAGATVLYLGARSRGGRCAVVTVSTDGVTLHSPGLAFYVANYSSLPSQVGTVLYAGAHTAFREVFYGRI